MLRLGAARSDVTKTTQTPRPLTRWLRVDGGTVISDKDIAMKFRRTPAKGVQLRVLAAESAHRMTGVASFILLADIGDQRLRALHLNFEGGDQRIFRVNDNVSRFPLKFKADRKLHCALPLFNIQKIAQFNWRM